MNIDALKRLALACCDGSRPYHKGTNLNELYVTTERAEEASHEFAAAMTTALEAAALADPERGQRAVKSAIMDMDSANGRAICDYEEQGFINGFRFAVQLLTECISPAGQEGAQK